MCFELRLSRNEKALLLRVVHRAVCQDHVCSESKDQEVKCWEKGRRKGIISAWGRLRSLCLLRVLGQGAAQGVG